MAEYCRQLSTRSRKRPSLWSCLTARRGSYAQSTADALPHVPAAITAHA